MENIIWQRFCRKIHRIWSRACVKLFLLYSYFSSSDSYFFPTFFLKLILLFSYFFIKGHFQACKKMPWLFVTRFCACNRLRYQVSIYRIIGPLVCICENKCADQLHGDRTADQLLCFRYIPVNSTVPLVPKSKIVIFCGCTDLFVWNLHLRL